MNDNIDHEARANANRALDQIEAHTKACEEAAKRSEKAQERMFATIERLHARGDKLLWGVSATLIAVIVQAVLKKIGLI